ncbi:AhpD-like protein [Xylariaceae sp. AK1471]|nr:AhpD-like protein [Xylariaceae sp. AK1471]
MRIPYVPNPPPTSTPEEAAILSRITARRAPRPLQPLDLALLHSPPIADGWNSFLGAVRTRSLLSAALRELAICRVAVCNSAWYEWGHHAPLAAAAGLGPKALDIVKKDNLSLDSSTAGGGESRGVTEEERKGAEEDGLGRKEWAVLRYTDEMTRNVKVSDETFDELRAVCDEREVVEVTATVACYNCVSRFLVALDGKSLLLTLQLGTRKAHSNSAAVGERNGTGPDDVKH